MMTFDEASMIQIKDEDTVDLVNQINNNPFIRARIMNLTQATLELGLVESPHTAVKHGLVTALVIGICIGQKMNELPIEDLCQEKP